VRLPVTLAARGFSRIGVGRHDGSDRGITVRWECE
jgi:hypothetical protein